MTSPMAGISRNLSCVLYVPYPVSGILLAVATLYVTDLGVEVVDTGRRRWVDTHWFRGNSYFRIGCEWVRTALENGWQLIRRVRFISHLDPELAKASRKQQEKRLYRLEFKVLTYQYAPK
ncbi:hypothetical protein [Moorena sp. SIO3I6]|uniref:hypothetical protein n=1 Tax=Moorena sp. SIO3I6 TaxID=2607831 RepID=UPI0025DD9351|nr:hypothetical protein [Moorena sp. SIO3I6]